MIILGIAACTFGGYFLRGSEGGTIGAAGGIASALVAFDGLLYFKWTGIAWSLLVGAGTCSVIYVTECCFFELMGHFLPVNELVLYSFIGTICNISLIVAVKLSKQFV